MESRMKESAADSASERVYRWTRVRILDGTFSGGEMISEGEVAQLVGVSRTPVREAFLKLSAEGVLRLFPKRGALVVAMTDADVRDLIEARLLVEPWAVKVVSNLPDRSALVDRLYGHIDELELSGPSNIVGHQEADRAFHEAIVGAAGNAVIVAFYRTLRDRQLRLGADVVAHQSDRAGIIISEHRAIADAIAGGDVAIAESVTNTHLETTRQVLAIRSRFD
jgi:DNA-binding GntR family transcriptional regulator